MTAITLTRHRSASARAALVPALARLEAARMLRHPLLPTSAVASVLWGWNLGDQPWSGARYSGYQVGPVPLLLAVSVICAIAAIRDTRPAFEDAPATPAQRALGRLLGAGALVGVVALCTAVAALVLRFIGGLDLGDEPGRTLHAHYSLPELLQPVALAALAVTLGLAAGRLLGNLLASTTVLFVFWFVVGAMYWVFNGPATMAMSVIQVQPGTVVAGPASADPQTFPSDWLLTAPGPYQDFWARLVVSPELAAWHDVYLLGLAAVAATAVVPRRWRVPVAVVGVLVAVVAVAVQRSVQP